MAVHDFKTGDYAKLLAPLHDWPAGTVLIVRADAWNFAVGAVIVHKPGVDWLRRYVRPGMLAACEKEAGS